MVSAGHMGGTRGSCIVSSAADVLLKCSPSVDSFVCQLH